ncbi:FtsX-like permease family protein [Nonomuraea sp. NPDC050556]|uniref:ABC transporter permease n=1 Tax=Nonomuraea sp. NPDC050556 TaxID=3364369 RepID=UPI00378875DF
MSLARTALAMAGISGLVVAFLAVFGGMALVTATGVIVDSAFRSEVPRRLSQADVTVSAKQSVPVKEDLPVALPERARVPAELVAEVAKVPGVVSAAGDVSFPVSGATGHGWSSLAYTGKVIEGRPPNAPDEVATKNGKVGQKLQIFANGTPGTYRVTAIVDAPGIYFTDATAAKLVGRTSVDLVAVRGDAADELEKRFGDRYVISTGGDAEQPEVAASRAMLLALPSSIGGISLIIVGFVVGGGLALSINRQRRDLALLRAAGATPRQVRKIIALQGTGAAVAALLPGAALGYVLASALGDLLVKIGALRPDQPLVYGPLPPIGAALLLLGVVRLASWSASLRVSRMSVVSGIADPRDPSRVRTGAGLLIMVGALVLATTPLYLRGEFAAIGPATAALLAVVGLALAGPRLVQVTTGALAARLPSRISAPVWLAVHNSNGNALRTAGAVAALGMVVTLGLSVVLTQTTIQRAGADEAEAGLRGVTSITAPRHGGIPHGLLDEVRTTAKAAPMSTTTVLTRSLSLGDDDKLMSRPALVLDPSAEGLVDLGVTGGALSGLKGATVALDERSGRVGEEIRLTMGDGTRVKARVVATYSRSLGFGPIVVSRDLAAGHRTTDLDETILVRHAPALDRWPGLVVSDRAVTPQASSATAQVLVNVAVLAVLLAYVLVAVANRLVATITGRRDELISLRRLGATPRQLRRMVRWEALVIAGAAAGSGLVLAGVPLGLLSVGFLGRPWPAGPLWLVPASVVLVGLVVWLALDLPARRVIS